MILIDTNIFMYAAGSAHKFKANSIKLLRKAAEGLIDSFIDAEILQEILHRYRAINRWEDGKKVYELTRSIMPVVEPVTSDIIDQTYTLLKKYPGIMARDALHAAICISTNADGICTYDRDFKQIFEIKSIQPEDLL